MSTSGSTVRLRTPCLFDYPCFVGGSPVTASLTTVQSIVVRDLLDRLPDTHVEPAEIEFQPLSHDPLEEDFAVLKPIPPFPV